MVRPGCDTQLTARISIAQNVAHPQRIGRPTMVQGANWCVAPRINPDETALARCAAVRLKFAQSFAQTFARRVPVASSGPTARLQRRRRGLQTLETNP